MSDQEFNLSAEALEQVSGLDDKECRRIAKDGYFPSPRNGKYNQVPTIKGMFKYFRDQKDLQTISLADLRDMTGWSDDYHRKLAARGYYPASINGHFKSTETMIGLIKLFKEKAAERNDVMAQETERKIKTQNEILDQEKALNADKLAVNSGKYITVDDIVKFSGELCDQIKSTISFQLESQIPMLCEGKSAADIRVITKDMLKGICDSMQAWAKKRAGEQEKEK